MAFIPLTETDIKTMGINSFDPSSGSLGTGFKVNWVEYADDGSIIRTAYEVLNTPPLYPVIYSTVIQTASTTLGTTGKRDTILLEKDV